MNKLENNFLGKWFKNYYQQQEAAQNEKNQKERFEQFKKFAENVAKEDPAALSVLVRMVAKSLQMRLLPEVSYNLKYALDAINLFSFLGKKNEVITPDNQTIDDLTIRIYGEDNKKAKYLLQLKRDPIFAKPQNKDNLISSLVSYGYGRRNGAWQEDPNHRVSLLLPFGVGIVIGGNHSIAAGIINGEGELTTDEVIDLSQLYEYIEYDGVNMLRKHNKKQFFKPQAEELGILFDLGRLMLKNNVVYDAPKAKQIHIKEGEHPICYKVFVDEKDTGFSLSQNGANKVIEQTGYDEKHITVEGKNFIFNGRQISLKHYTAIIIYDDLEQALTKARLL